MATARQPGDLRALHEGLRGLRHRLHHPPFVPDDQQQAKDPYEQAPMARFTAALDTTAGHARPHRTLTTDYRNQLVELAEAATALLDH